MGIELGCRSGLLAALDTLFALDVEACRPALLRLRFFAMLATRIRCKIQEIEVKGSAQVRLQVKAANSLVMLMMKVFFQEWRVSTALIGYWGYLVENRFNQVTRHLAGKHGPPLSSSSLPGTGVSMLIQ